MALHVQIDVTYPDNHKIVEAGLDGMGLHTAALCIARRNEGDGWLARGVLRRLGASDDLIDRLVELRLLEVNDDGRLRPWGYLDRNPSQAAIDAIRATKAEAARTGNHKRWGHKGSVDDCPKCTPDAQVVAGCDRTGSQTLSHCDPGGSPETETETEKTNNPSPASAPALTAVPSRSRSADADGFSDWWKRYPNKAGKHEASQAWAKAVRGGRGMKPVSVEVLNDRLTAQLRVWRRDGTEGSYIPRASTWLNKRRFEDDILTAAPRPVGQYAEIDAGGYR